MADDEAVISKAEGGYINKYSLVSRRGGGRVGPDSLRRGRLGTEN
jgi:hypothetical protein